MEVDANNDGTVDATDESIKDDPSLPGKVIVANTLDENGDNKPGYADFNSFRSLYPMAVTLSNVDTTKAKLRFEYSAADPSLVNSISVPGADIPKYTPGTVGYPGFLRLWSASTARDPRSIATGGNFIPNDTAFPASDLIFDGSNSTTIQVEGVNRSDPSNTEVKLQVDPLGTGDWTTLDAVRFPVAKVQLVYTDVSGVTHDTGDTFDVLGVPRIASNLEPDGVAADWMNGVDDGSALLVRVVGSPALETLAANSDNSLNFFFGEEGFPAPGGIGNLSTNDGYVHSMDDGFVANAAGKLQTLGIEPVGSQWGTSGMTVLAADFYRPPNEFDLSEGTGDTDTFRRIPLAMQMQLNGKELTEGGKPEGLMLTRPPLVLVHGINSGPGVWFDATGGTSFVTAAIDAGYPTAFEADHTGADPVDPAGKTYGEGELADMYLDVKNEISTATDTYRSSALFPSDPYAQPATDGALPDAMIATQKVDVVAHSYGGLLTRWYVEQSPEYPNRRDVRKVVELGTPNLGSPLANMVDEIYTDPTIGAASPEAVGYVDEKALLNYLDANGKSGSALPSLVSAAPGGTSPFPFYEDDSVNSARLQQLNADPFNDDIGYAAVVGTQTTLGGAAGKTINFQPYYAFGPTTKGDIYFPWLYQFDGSGATDAVVPVWSASLGVPAYNFAVNANHISLVQNSVVQGKALEWLSDPNLPLGSVQRTAWNNQPPINDRNAYTGATADPATGAMIGAGLNPDAIIGVSLPGTGLGQATFWTSTSADGTSGSPDAHRRRLPPHDHRHDSAVMAGPRRSISGGFVGRRG